MCVVLDIEQARELACAHLLTDLAVVALVFEALLVVNRLPFRVILREDLHGDLLETLAAKTSIELLQAQLRVDTHQLSQIPKRGFLGLGLGTSIICQALQALRPLRAYN